MIRLFPIEAKVHDIKYYHESGDILKVEILNARKRNYGINRGISYNLKVLEIVKDNTGVNNNVGYKFEVWKSLDSGGQGGWSLLDY